MNGGAVWLVVETRLWSESEAQRELQNLALTLGEQTEQALTGAELVQTSLAEQVASSHYATAAEFAASLGRFDIHRTLRDKISGLPHVGALTIIDGRGALINFSRYWPIPEIDVSDRDYFKVLSTTPALQSFVSEPIRNRGDGRSTVYLARALRSDTGEFLGLVLAALDLAYFERLYGSVMLGSDSAITLMRRDGTLLARYPQIDHVIPRSTFAESPLFKDTLAKADHGTVLQTSPIDGADRLVSGRTLRSFPVVVTVSTPMDHVLAPWHRDVTSVALALLLLNGLIASAVVLGLRQMAGYALSAALARHDALTGLPNRLALREWMDGALASGHPFWLALIDLDDFKLVNDVLGHPTGDALLCRAGAILNDLVAPGDLVARLGGDEFAIVSRSGAFGDICERALARFRAPMELGGRQVTISTSLGVAAAPPDGTDPDELLRRADMALYDAKAAGRDTWRRFDRGMEDRVLDRQALEDGLRVALREGEFALYLQPIVDLGSNEPSGFEALLRWHHPERGSIPPGEFVPIAESSGLIVPIGEWILREACAEARTWTRPLSIAVNLSSVQFASGDLVATVRRALAETGLPPWRLELEITESVLLQKNDTVLATLHDLRALGIRIALDDFGTGYSSLSYLVSFPFDRIKIDRSFVEDMLTNSDSATVVRATIALAKSLGLQSTTEGVETLGQLDALREAGSSAVQGFLFSRPKPARAVAADHGLVADADAPRALVA